MLHYISGNASTLGKNRCCVSIFGRVFNFQGRFNIVCPHDGQNRSKHFFFCNCHIWSYKVYNCWSYIKSTFCAFNFPVSAIHKHLGTSGFCFCNVAFDSLFCFQRNHRTQIFTWNYFPCFLTYFTDNMVSTTNSYHCGSRHTSLTCTSCH